MKKKELQFPSFNVLKESGSIVINRKLWGRKYFQNGHIAMRALK
jgi:hypothetical protein